MHERRLGQFDRFLQEIIAANAKRAVEHRQDLRRGLLHESIL